MILKAFSLQNSSPKSKQAVLIALAKEVELEIESEDIEKLLQSPAIAFSC